MTSRSRALFDGFALRILAKLHEAFPAEITLRPNDIALEEGLEPTNDVIGICDLTLSWLWHEGFFRSPGSIIGGVTGNVGKAHQTIYPQARPPRRV
jgi:hypothetical protein